MVQMCGLSCRGKDPMKTDTMLRITTVSIFCLIFIALTGYCLDNKYVLIGVIVAMIPLILFVKFVPEDKEQNGFPKEII